MFWIIERKSCNAIWIAAYQVYLWLIIKSPYTTAVSADCGKLDLANYYSQAFDLSEFDKEDTSKYGRLLRDFHYVLFPCVNLPRSIIHHHSYSYSRKHLNANPAEFSIVNVYVDN